MNTKDGQKKTTISDNQEFIEFSKSLSDAKRILISTHQLPDGDGLGAESALFHYLKRARKSCRIYNPDPLPRRYSFLDPKSTHLLGPGQVEIWDTFDLWVIVDTNDPRRLGPLWKELSLRAKKIIFLDHHPHIKGENEIQYPPHTSVVSDTTSSSIGELLYHLFNDLGLAKLNLDIATGLYVSVMTDTNSFRYARTTPLAHQIAGEMISFGVNPEMIYQDIYSSKRVSHLQLLGKVLQGVKVSSSGKLAWLELPLDLRKEHSASVDDTQSFLNLLLLLESAEIVCLYREEENGQTRVSIKSKGSIIINKIAMEHGGGGHDYAAGVALEKPLRETVSLLNEKLDSLIDSYERFGK